MLGFEGGNGRADVRIIETAQGGEDILLLVGMMIRQGQLK